MAAHLGRRRRWPGPGDRARDGDLARGDTVTIRSSGGDAVTAEVLSISHTGGALIRNV